MLAISGDEKEINFQIRRVKKGVKSIPEIGNKL